MRVNLGSCTERQMLEVGVAAAIQKTYMARHDLKSAKTDKSADTAPFTIALEQARSKQREAEKAHHKHVEEHGCRLSGITLNARPGS